MAPAALIAGMTVVLMGGPDLLDGYAALLAWTLMIQAALAFSYHLVAGIAGRMHLGHGLCFGLGAYASAIALNAGWGPGPALAIAAGCGAGAGLALALVLVSLNGSAFALASLALVLGAKALAVNGSGLTGGTAGLAITTLQTMGGPLRQALIVLATTVWIHHALFASRPGRALRAAAADPVAAAGLGLCPQRLVLPILTLASALAALAGGIYPQVMGYVSPQSAFGLETALAPVVAVMAGGVGTRWGPLLGTVFWVGLQEYLFTRGWPAGLALLGLALIVVGLALPQGLAGLADTISGYFSARTDKS